MSKRQRANAFDAGSSASDSGIGSEESYDESDNNGKFSSRRRKPLPAGARTAKGAAKRVPQVKISLIAKVVSLATTAADNAEKDQAEERCEWWTHL